MHGFVTRSIRINMTVVGLVSCRRPLGFPTCFADWDRWGDEEGTCFCYFLEEEFEKALAEVVGLSCLDVFDQVVLLSSCPTPEVADQVGCRPPPRSSSDTTEVARDTQPWRS